MRSTKVQGIKCRALKQFTVHEYFIDLLVNHTFHYSGVVTKYQYYYNLNITSLINLVPRKAVTEPPLRGTLS